MSEQADVRNLDAVRDARAAVAEYRETAQRALAEAVSGAERATRHVAEDLRLRWEGERRRQERRLNQLKSELARAELQAQGQGGMVSVREEKARVEQCRQAIEHATRKLERVRHWGIVLERDLGMLKGQLQNLGRMTEGDLKRAEAGLALTERRLEEYLRPHREATPTRPADANAAPAPGAGSSPGHATDPASGPAPDAPPTEDDRS